MTANDRKTICANNQPLSIVLWADVQHGVHAYNNDFFLAVQRGGAEIVDARGDRIGWGGCAGEGQRLFARPVAPEGAP